MYIRKNLDHVTCHVLNFIKIFSSYAAALHAVQIPSNALNSRSGIRKLDLRKSIQYPIQYIGSSPSRDWVSAWALGSAFHDSHEGSLTSVAEAAAPFSG